MHLYIMQYVLQKTYNPDMYIYIYTYPFSRSQLNHHSTTSLSPQARNSALLSVMLSYMAAILKAMKINHDFIELTKRKGKFGKDSDF